MGRRRAAGADGRVRATRRCACAENDAYSDGVTVHHHGVHMVGTPYYDGTAQIAQPCSRRGSR